MALKFDNFSNIINGRSRPTKLTRHGVNPATKENLWPSPLSTLDDVHAAVDAATRAKAAWAAVSWEDRQKLVSDLADALCNHAKEFAMLLTTEQGKPLSAAENELSQVAQMLRGSAKLHLPDRVVEQTGEEQTITRHIPVGVCVGIVPWNFPLVLLSFKLGPALVAGNPIIIKPSPFTPYAGLKFVEMAQAIFPPGVVQALAGDDNLGPWLTEHPGVDKVSFTGSTATGIRVLQSCAKTVKRVTLELGGNDPAIVCPNVDIDTVVAKIGTLALYNSGQVCIAIKRVYIHSSIYDDFVEKLAAFVRTLNVGDGMDSASTLGPVQNSMQFGKIKSLVESIKSEGLKIITTDHDNIFSNDKGFFINPVIVDNPPDDSKIVTEEPFGPVFPVLKWDTEEEVLRRANASRDALGASVWSNDAAQASRIARQLQAGSVWINSHMELRSDAAFGGLKQSGMGCELGLEGLRAYCNVQTIHHEAT